MSVEFRNVQDIHVVRQPISRTLFFWRNWNSLPSCNRYPQPLAPTIRLSVRMNVTTLGASYKWNREHLSFCDWQVSIMSSRFIHVVVCVRTSSLRLNNILLCTHPVLLIYSSVSGQLGSFHISVIVNNAAMNRGIQSILQNLLSVMLGIYPEVELDHMVILLLVLRNHHDILHNGRTILHSHQQCTGFQFPPSSSNLVIFCFHSSHPNVCKVVSHCSLHLYFPKDQ